MRRLRECRPRVAGEDDDARVYSNVLTTMTTSSRSLSVSPVCSCVNRTSVSQACRNSCASIRMGHLYRTASDSLSHLCKQVLARQAHIDNGGPVKCPSAYCTIWHGMTLLPRH